MLPWEQAHVGSPRATEQRFSRLRHCRRPTMHARMQRSTRWISTGDEVATGPSRAFLASGRSVTPGLARCHRWTHCPWRTQHPGTAILLRVVPASQLRLATRLAMRCTLLAMRCTLLAMRNTRTILQCGPPGISSLKKKLSPPVKKRHWYSSSAQAVPGGSGTRPGLQVSIWRRFSSLASTYVVVASPLAWYCRCERHLGPRTVLPARSPSDRSYP